MTRYRIGWMALALAAASACSREEAHKSAAASASARPKTKLEQDLAAAASATASAATQGPPPGGVFAPGKADAEAPPGAPPTVTVVNLGAAPRITLARQGLPAGGKLRLLVDAQAFQGQLPPIDYTLEVAGGKDDKRDAQTKPAGAAASAEPEAATQAVSLQVTGAEIDKQAGDVPDKLAKLVAKFKGSTVSANLTPAGSLANLQLRPPDGAKADVKDLALLSDSLLTALDLFFSPMPAEPVGQGAKWIAADRGSFALMPVVRYRATTLQKVEGDMVTLSVDLRQYDADAKFMPFGVKQLGLEVAAFDSFGQAIYTRSRGDLWPVHGQVALPVKIKLAKDGAPLQGQLASLVQAELNAARDDDKRKK